MLRVEKQAGKNGSQSGSEDTEVATSWWPDQKSGVGRSLSQAFGKTKSGYQCSKDKAITFLAQIQEDEGQEKHRAKSPTQLWQPTVAVGCLLIFYMQKRAGI